MTTVCADAAHSRLFLGGAAAALIAIGLVGAVRIGEKDDAKALGKALR